MYEELVNELRNKYRAYVATDNEKPGRLFKQAADALEEIQKYLEQSKNFEAFWQQEAEEALRRYQVAIANKPRWIPVAERLPSDFVSVQAHMTDAGNFPPVREAYVVDKLWFFPALKEFHPVDMWRQFDEPPKEE